MILKKVIITTLIFIQSLNESPEKPKILIIGDSISIGYTPFVKEALSSKFDVYHNRGNAQNTGTGMDSISKWIEKEDWDIIQFNWGLWDLCYRNPESKNFGNRDKVTGKITFSIVDYKSNLDSIIKILKAKTKAKLVFVTTTYVPENEVGRFRNDAIKYNEAAKEIMKKNNIPINDIYAKSIDIHKQFGLGSDNVHYKPEGYIELSKLIIDFIETEVEMPKK
jgi:hypothetical protein